MKRKDLLQETLTEDKNVSKVVTNIIRKDAKFLAKAERDIKDKVDELETSLEDRLASDTPLDKSTVEVLYSSLVTQRDLLKLYSDFNKEFLKGEEV